VIYDVTILTVRPGMHPQALDKLKDWLAAAPLSGKLLACWFSELGAVNQILLLRHYDDEGRLLSDRRAVLESGNPCGAGEFLVTMTMDTYVPFPIRETIEPGDFGPIYEVRTYELKSDGLKPTIALWDKAVPARAKISPVIAAMYSVTGTVTRFLHIWAYRSLDERMRLRAKSVADGVWPPPGGPGHLISQQADIYLPAPFSPLC
jgi:hypothetical protein